MNAQRYGMTMVELLFVLLLGSLILAIGTREAGHLTDRRAAVSARNAVVTTALIAKSTAMERGRPVYLRVRPDSGWVRVGVAADTLVQEVRMSDYGVTMLGNDLDLCYTSRGYAAAGCTTVSSPARVGFRRGGHTEDMVVMPLGQMRRLP